MIEALRFGTVWHGRRTDRLLPSRREDGQATIALIGLFAVLVGLGIVVSVVARIYSEQAKVQQAADIGAAGYGRGGANPGAYAEQLARANGARTVEVTEASDGRVRVDVSARAPRIAGWFSGGTLQADATVDPGAVADDSALWPAYGTIHVASVSGAVGTAIGVALSYLGMPYVWGGNSPLTGFDCSGLVQWAYGQAGVSLPRTTYEQWDAGIHVPASGLQPGDIVFFSHLDHEGLYLGNGRYVEAPHTGAAVRVEMLDTDSSYYAGAVRPFAVT